MKYQTLITFLFMAPWRNKYEMEPWWHLSSLLKWLTNVDMGGDQMRWIRISVLGFGLHVSQIEDEKEPSVSMNFVVQL